MHRQNRSSRVYKYRIVANSRVRPVELRSTVRNRATKIGTHVATKIGTHGSETQKEKWKDRDRRKMERWNHQNENTKSKAQQPSTKKDANDQSSEISIIASNASAPASINRIRALQPMSHGPNQQPITILLSVYPKSVDTSIWDKNTKLFISLFLFRYNTGGIRLRSGILSETRLV